MPLKSWTSEDLKLAVSKSYSFRSVIKMLYLQPAGGNYKQIKKYIRLLKIDTKHFTGKMWNKGKIIGYCPKIPTSKILTEHSNFQSFKLKKGYLKRALRFPSVRSVGGKLPPRMGESHWSSIM
ncbi:hypothetical protein HYV31_01660 [candidate division WWE3 bacterium]|nr:hypothetical protein [candidate division WWE3 bacterium]